MSSKPSTPSVDLAFCERLPKVELHAHLSGSVSRTALQAIWEGLPSDDAGRTLAAPTVALADEKRPGQSITTFFPLFGEYTHRLLGSEGALRFATRSVLQDFAADGVVYLELRTTPRALSADVPASAAVGAVLDEIEAWNAAAANPLDASLPSPPWRPGPPAPTPRMKAALLLSVDRARHSAADALGVADLAVALRDAGRPVAGLDLSGDPAAPAPVVQFAPAFRRAGAAGLRLAVHFAELPASGSRDELDELLSWRPRRLGHCIYVPDELRERLAPTDNARGGAPAIGVEMCISCNVLAGMLPGAVSHAATKGPMTERELRVAADAHHARWWIGRRAEVSVCTDDVGVFHRPGSAEHFLAARIAPALSRAGLVALSWRAMSGAFCDDTERLRVRHAVEQFAAQEGLHFAKVG